MKIQKMQSTIRSIVFIPTPQMQFIEPDTCVLVIHDVILKDEGLYSISARNVAGSVSTSAMLHVEESEHEYSNR